MEKTFLETQIDKRAEKRFWDEYNAMITAMSKTKIGQMLKIKVDEKSFQSLVNYSGQTGGTFFNAGSKSNVITEYGSGLTNIHAIKEELIEKYREEETASILDQLDEIKYLFDPK